MERKTRQRAAILRIFQESERALSPRETHALAQRLENGIGIATVYRAVNELTAEGFLIPVMLPGKEVRYEATGRKHHHFFHCDDCDQVYAAPGCMPEVNALAPDGFEVQRHEVILYGRCAACKSHQKKNISTSKSVEKSSH